MFNEAVVIDGRYYANKLLLNLKHDIDIQKRQNNLRVKLAIILIGMDPPSAIYVKNKINAAKKVGIETDLYKLDNDISEQLLLHEIDRINNDDSVSGIIVQLPLPNHISKEKVINVINPAKDVDGFHPFNMGLLYSGYDLGFIPCTARGVLELIKMTGVEISGKNAVIIGRSNIVGKPVAALLSGENATVTLCHSKTKELSSITCNADIVVSAVGNPGFLKAEFFSQKAIVIDVGINRLIYDDQCALIGDVDFESVKHKVSYITPVPGGVGPMTIAYLLINTFRAAALQHNLPSVL